MTLTFSLFEISSSVKPTQTGVLIATLSLKRQDKHHQGCDTHHHEPGGDGKQLPGKRVIEYRPQGKQRAHKGLTTAFEANRTPGEHQAAKDQDQLKERNG